MKNRKQNHFMTMALVVMVIASMLAIPVSASISPDNVEATLNPGESLIVDKTVTIPDPPYPVKADVIFVFDLTGSMSGVINEAKAKSGDIMDTLDATGVDIQYGVVSYMDYPHAYTSCGYSSTYGSAYGDYAYALNQSITSDQTAVKDAINGLTLGSGADGPQDYTRAMYESYADSAIGWRPGAKRIIVNFGDNVPHDCNLNEGVPGKTGTWTTGGDPGRDEVMGTADDLDLQTVLADMAANNVILLECHTTTAYEEYWEYWTGITGGDVYITSSTTLVDDVVNAITTGFIVPKVYGLHLKASTGFESWVSAVPAEYAEVDPGATVTFVETIQVPVGTAPGAYTFTVSAMDNKSVSFGDQTDIITVPGGPGGVGPTVESALVSGTPENTFQIGDPVYAVGSDYPAAGAIYDLYVVDDTTWTDGMAIPSRVAGTETSLTTDGSGDIPAGTLIWGSSVEGEYDIIVDVDGNGQYDAATDGLDSGSPGFVVIGMPSAPVPALAPIGIIALIGLLCVIGMIRIRRRFN